MKKSTNKLTSFMDKSKSWFLIFFILVLLPCPVYSGDDRCGGQYSAGNPYYCCSNGGNCTWWAWRQAKNAWGDFPTWTGNAKDWARVLGASPYNYPVSSTPAVGTIACNTTASADGVVNGHVAWVTGIVGNTVYFNDMDCCVGCNSGFNNESASISYFDGGYIYPKCGPNLCGSVGGCTLSAGTYTLTCPIYVNSGASLQIMPGVTLNYNGHSFTVNGQLIWGP